MVTPRVFAASSVRAKQRGQLVPVLSPHMWAQMSRMQLLAELRSTWSVLGALAFAKGYYDKVDTVILPLSDEAWQHSLDFDLHIARSSRAGIVELRSVASPVRAGMAALAAASAPPAFTRPKHRRGLRALVRPNRERWAGFEGGWLVIFSEGWPGERRLWAPTLAIACEAGRHKMCNISHLPPEVRLVIPPPAS